jgi:predicted ATPase
MKILKFSFSDKAKDWSLKEVAFERLTLLVGASGVGKTQILNAIQHLTRIANGIAISGVKWEMEFETATGQNYCWTGEFENTGASTFFLDVETSESQNVPAKIIFESLFLNGHEVIKRDSLRTLFEGRETLKLSPEQSILFILKEEAKVKPAFDGFKKIIFCDYSRGTQNHFVSVNPEKLLNTYKTLGELQESFQNVGKKLFFVYRNGDDVFNKIKARFCEIFPQVEDVKIEPLDTNEKLAYSIFLRDSPVLQIKEKQVDKWITQFNMSSGMFRSLIHIAEIYLCQDGTVFLIDEFENSLGINCIDELTTDILDSGRPIQFIITSHHPYIINNIPYKDWKLVTRRRGTVSTHTMEQYQFGKSKHDAFMQLLQLEAYQTGME